MGGGDSCRCNVLGCRCVVVTIVGPGCWGEGAGGGLTSAGGSQGGGGRRLHKLIPVVEI